MPGIFLVVGGNQMPCAVKLMRLKPETKHQKVRYSRLHISETCKLWHITEGQPGWYSPANISPAGDIHLYLRHVSVSCFLYTDEYVISVRGIWSNTARGPTGLVDLLLVLWRWKPQFISFLPGGGIILFLRRLCKPLADKYVCSCSAHHNTLSHRNPQSELYIFHPMTDAHTQILKLLRCRCDHVFNSKVFDLCFSSGIP